MATLQELRGLFSYSDLVEKVEVAVIIAAFNMIDGGTPTAAQKAWAVNVFSSPQQESKKALMSVLAANKSLTVAQIQGASDSAVQTQVNIVVPVLVDAMAGV